MGKLKQLWYRLVATDLLEDNVSLAREVERLTLRVAELSDETRIRYEADARAISDVVKQRLGMDAMLPGKLQMVRDQLRSELAYSSYLEDNLREGTTPFNELPLETRKMYFKQIADKVAYDNPKLDPS